jgi:5-methylcytosine-specific restriction endonuclease McrA
VSFARHRRIVLHRDDYTCVWCGENPVYYVDHIYPRRLGGGDELDNLVAVCPSCNVRKGYKELGYEWVPDRYLSGWFYDCIPEPEQDRLPGEMES